MVSVWILFKKTRGIMIKVAFKFKDGKPLINWKRVENNLRERYPNKDLFTAKFSAVSAPKTYSQLRYFHSNGFIGRIIDGYREAGFDVPNEKAEAIEWVKFQIKTHPDIMFIKRVKNEQTDRNYVIPRSFKNATKEEMSKIIEWCIRNYQEYFGIVLETADEYKHRLGLR